MEAYQARLLKISLTVRAFQKNIYPNCKKLIIFKKQLPSTLALRLGIAHRLFILFPFKVFVFFRITAFTFLPNMFNNALPNAQYSSSFGNTIFNFFGDMIFLRNMGYIYTVLLVLVVFMLVLLFLWKKKIGNAKPWSKRFLKERFWFKHLHGLVYVLWLPTFCLGLVKMRNYTSTTPIEGFSIFSSFLFMLPMFAAPIVFAVKVYRLVRDHPVTCQMISKGYDYIAKQEIVMDSNPIYYFTYDNNEVNITEMN